jgi:putative NADH-flavin reductase
MAESMSIDMKMALNAEIVAQGHSEQALTRDVPVVITGRGPKRVANTAETEWNMGASEGPGGTFQEHWPKHLPRPPSMRKITDEETADSGNPNMPKVIVFNANTQEGSSMVRVLSEKGLKVVAVVRVFTSRNTKNLTKLKNVVVKVADLNNKEAVLLAAEGCQSAFLVTKFWQRFESPIEEQMANVVVTASADVGIKRLVLATFEDTLELRLRGRKSQLQPTVDGRIFPSFTGMDAIDALSKEKGVQITHMMTSYLDEADSKKSLILIRGENGRIITQGNIQ